MSGDERLLEERWRIAGMSIIEGKEARGDDLIAYFLPHGVRSTF